MIFRQSQNDLSSYSRLNEIKRSFEREKAEIYKERRNQLFSELGFFTLYLTNLDYKRLFAKETNLLFSSKIKLFVGGFTNMINLVAKLFQRVAKKWSLEKTFLKIPLPEKTYSQKNHFSRVFIQFYEYIDLKPWAQ